MIGCLGAIFYVYNKETFLRWPFKLYQIIIAFVLFRTVPILMPNLYFAFELSLHLVYILLVLNLISQPNSSKGTSISSLGQMTYGMYLYHPIIIILTKICFDYLKLQYQLKPMVNFLMAIIALSITVLVSYLSYNFIEKRILKLKSKFSKVKTRE
jgi:peptidoglycan/LPS O-acetylase OafA/YrhL